MFDRGGGSRGGLFAVAVVVLAVFALAVSVGGVAAQDGTADEPDRRFVENPYVDEQGAVVDVTVELNGPDGGVVQLGDPDDDEFTTVVEFSDESADGYDEITLQFNTHTHATNGPADVVENDGWSVVEDDVTVVDATTPEPWPAEPLDEGEYELIVGDSFDGSSLSVESPDDAAYLALENWTPPEQFRTEVAPADDAIVGDEAYRNATVTESAAVADGDHLIGVVPDFETSGLVDAIASTVDEGDDAFGPALADHGVTVTVGETAIPEHVETTWNSSLDPDRAFESGEENPLVLEAVTLDGYDGDLAFVVDYEASEMARYDDADFEYEVSVSIDDRNPYVDEEQSVATDQELLIEAPDVGWDEELAQVPTTDEVTVTGATNVAPGTDVSTVARETGHFSFSEATVVDADGTFEATYNFSDLKPGVEFDLEAMTSGRDDEVSAETRIVLADTPMLDVRVDAPETVRQGADVTVDVTITNRGEVTDTTTYEATVGDETDQGEIALAVGQEWTAEYDLDTSELGEIQWNVTGEYDDASGTVVVADEATGADPVYDLEIENDGTPSTIAFPAAVNGTVADVFHETEHIAIVWEYHDGGWEQVLDWNETRIDAMEAMVVVTDGEGPETIPVTVELETTSASGFQPPAERTLSPGWNFVGATSYTDVETSFGIVDETVRVLDPFDGPGGDAVPDVDGFAPQTLQHSPGLDTAPLVDPFKGYFVFVDAAGGVTLPGEVAGIEDRADADEQLGISTVG